MDPGTHATGTELTDGRRDPKAIRRHIEVTRTELGDTVAALTVKADVRAQVRDRIAGARQTTRARREAALARARGASPATVRSAAANAATFVRGRPLPFAAVTALLAGLALGRLLAPRG